MIKENTQLSSLTELDIRFRNYADDKFPPEALYAYNLEEGLDLSLNNAGELFQQNKDFILLELSIDQVRRAGPSRVSPTRVWGTLDLSIFTKGQRDKVKFGSQLEVMANWFQNETISGIRFREYQPSSVVPSHGFTSYSGLINFEFEIVAQGSV